MKRICTSYVMRRTMLFSVLIVALTVTACSPQLGSSWYPSVGSGITLSDFVIEDIVVSGNKVRPYPEGNFETARYYSVNVSESIDAIDADSLKVVVSDKNNPTQKIPLRVNVNGDSMPLIKGERMPVTISVADANNNYNAQSLLIYVSREGTSTSAEDDPTTTDPNTGDPNTSDPAGSGGASQNNQTTVTPPSDPTQPYELPAVDRFNAKKYIEAIKTTVVDLDPFDYYNAESGGFSASKFDQWILNMTSITSSNVASYRFLEGTWTGDAPGVCSGPDIGGGQLNSSWNLKYYRYKTRIDRWKDDDPSYSLVLTQEQQQKEERFHFFKFTGDASANTKLNNSMFCVDTYTKFLFFYSEPGQKSSIFGNIIPSEWRDYAAPTYGNAHTYSDIPFYETDPVGYVKEDGSVVIYPWCVSNIEASNYGPMQNSLYTKVAGYSRGKAGRSPYREQIRKTDRSITRTLNTKYTVTSPKILVQPLDSGAKIGDEVSVKVICAIPPQKRDDETEGESLQYQWYKKASQNDNVGILIEGATESEYKIDTSALGEGYYYCVVTAVNPHNNETDAVTSDSAFVQVSPDGTLKVNAKRPVISVTPEQKKVRLGSGTQQISLTAIASVNDGGSLSYQWYSNTEANTDTGTAITDATNDTYELSLDTSVGGITYYYCTVTNTNTEVSGETTATVTSSLIPIEVEELYQVFFDVTGEGGRLSALVNGGAIESGAYVKKGSMLVLLANLTDGYQIKEWAGLTETRSGVVQLQTINETATITLECEKIPNNRTLTIRPVAIVNNLENRDKERMYFTYDIRMRAYTDAHDRGAYISLADQFKGKTLGWSVNWIFSGAELPNGRGLFLPNAEKVIEYPDPQEHLFFDLDIVLRKYDRKWDSGAKNGFTFSDAEQSTITFAYNKASDTWTVQHINNNRASGIDLETIEPFTMRRSRVRSEYPLTFIVSDSGTNTVGKVQVLFELMWQ